MFNKRWIIGFLAVLATACAASNGANTKSSPNDDTSSDGGAGGAGGQGGGDGPAVTVGGLGGSTTSTSSGGVANAKLAGTVFAPEGSIPVSGALVYLVKDAPAPIPSGAFCAKCIEITASMPYALSAADGRFEFDAPAGSYKLVVTHGMFRRVRAIEVAEGQNDLAPALTTLPGKSGVGDDIPNMAVIADGYDDVYNTLAKLGLGQVDSTGELIEGSASFSIYDDWDSPLGDGASLFTDLSELQQYHIVFIPCTDAFDDYLALPKVQQNLRKYVEAGGRLYVTDYSYEVINRAFSGRIEWHGGDGSLGSATVVAYDAPAVISDPGLADWLQAQNISSFDLVDSFTIIDSVHEYQAPDEDGIIKTFKPKVWMNSVIPNLGTRPATVTFQHGCGKALFSTYHTEGQFGVGLMPQERALLYTILEVAVCIGTIEPPS